MWNEFETGRYKARKKNDIPRLLLTGAGGFVGSHTLIHLLHNTDWHIVITDSFKHQGKIDRINEVLKSYPEFKERVTLIVHDLVVPFSKQTINKMGKIDYIISMASESHVDRSITDPRPFVENNVSLILTLLEYAREYPVEKFLQVSTDEVYGPADPGYAHKEGEPHRPSNPYSASKAAQENICYSYWRTYDMPIIISNTMNIIGEMQDPEKLVPRAIQAVINDETLPIFGDKDGNVNSTRIYLHARNQADALLYLLKNVTPASFLNGEEISQYNVVGNKELTNLEMAQLVAKFANKELKYEIVDSYSVRPGHDPRYALDGSKIAELGWVAPLSFEDSLKSTVEWTIENKEWIL